MTEKKAYLVHYTFTGTPSLIFASNIREVADRNTDAIKIELLNCWIVPGQLKEGGS